MDQKPQLCIYYYTFSFIFIICEEYSLNLLDTTNTTSQVDYKTTTNAETAMLTNPDDTSSTHRGEASMILMEILA